ncbi:hypothetical protein [Akkermansia massiliensis]
MMSITVTNPEGRKVEFKDQRGPTCGLYALSFVLEYLYDIKMPATADGDKTKESLRNKFKKDGKTVIGELYDATPSMADYIKGLESTKIKCQSVACDVPSIIETLNGGGLCMVPFCVDAGGNPDNSGIHAHWCVLQAVPDKTKPGEVTALHWGDRMRKFSLAALKNSNSAIKDVDASWWGKEKDSTGLRYYHCEAEQSTAAKDSYGVVHQIKEGSVKLIPATPLSKNLAGKMLVFAK